MISDFKPSLIGATGFTLMQITPPTTAHLEAYLQLLIVGITAFTQFWQLLKKKKSINDKAQ